MSDTPIIAQKSPFPTEVAAETTPNPATLKFIPGVAVRDTGTIDFATWEAAARSPLASRLYDVNGVDGVFFGGDFITVTKAGLEAGGLIRQCL